MSTAFELLAYLKKGDLVLRDRANFCHRFAKKISVLLARILEIERKIVDQHPDFR
jgi:hypothetical protein